MNTTTTNPTTAMHRWVQASHTIRRMFSFALSAGLTAAVLLAVFMSGCREEVPGIVNVCIAPTVIRTSPDNGGTNEPLSKRSEVTGPKKAGAVKVITATFSMPMDPKTITTSTFTVQQGDLYVQGTVSYSDTTAVFIVPNSLTPNLIYTCTITTGVQSTEGTALEGNYVWTFSTIAAGTPTLVSPIDNAVNQPVIVTFNWNTIPNADTYRLQVSLDPGFVTTVFNDSTITNTSQVVSGLSIGTKYYWRVNSKIAGGSSAYSDVWSFTTITVPLPPVLILPAASATNVSTAPNLSWSTSTGANTYRLQVSTSSAFVTTVYNNGALTGTSQSITGLIGGTVYYWRVSATNAAGTSAYSTRSFTTIAAGTPTLVAPLDSAQNQSVNPTLVWNVVPGASSYRLQVSTSATFATTLYNDSTLTGTSQLISGLAVGTTYYWRVNSKISGQTSNYSDVWRFTTVAPPAVPILVSPLNAATNQTVNPTLIWNDVSGAETYRLQVSTSNTFATTVYNDSTRTSTSQVVTGLSIGTTYYWRVNAKNIAGTSAYSSIRSFTTIVVPAAPALFSPADLAVNQPVNLNLIWIDVPGAESYRLQVSTSNTFATTIYNDSTLTSTSQQMSGLAVGMTYYWRVNAKNTAGTSVYSVVRSFTTIVVPAAPVLVAPLNLAVNQPANVTLIWNSVPGATTYRLQVSTSNTFATTVYNDSTRTSTSQQMTGLTLGVTYYWRVNAKNLAGTSVYSTVWSFNTTAAPLAPVLISPLNLASNVATNPTLSWNASIGATSYRLQVSTSSTFATTIFNDSTITGTQQSFTGLNNGTTYYWRVNAKNSSGTSAYATRSFTTIVAAPLPPILELPLDAATDQKLSLTLRWLASVGATTYRVQVDTTLIFATPIVDDSTVTGLLQPLTGLKTFTTYYWRVNAKNSGGTSAYSTVWSFTTGNGLAPGAVWLNSAATYGIMATSAITNTGFSVINGDVSLDPGTSMTGFPDGIVNGTIHINDTESEKARLDLLDAYNFAKSKPPGTTISAGADLGALYPLGIPPGTYTSGSTMLVSTELVLDAGGNADAVWVFQIGSSLTTGANVSITNGAQAKNIFWVPTEDATIGVGTIFHGTIVSGRDVTAITGATINGRILAGAITAGTIALQTTTVNVPLP
ncbi:MAG: ice-binding family protein [Bacteroidota bacterium]